MIASARLRRNLTVKGGRFISTDYDFGVKGRFQMFSVTKDQMPRDFDRGFDLVRFRKLGNKTMLALRGTNFV